MGGGVLREPVRPAGAGGTAEGPAVGGTAGIGGQSGDMPFPDPLETSPEDRCDEQCAAVTSRAERVLPSPVDAGADAASEAGLDAALIGSNGSCHWVVPIDWESYAPTHINVAIEKIDGQVEPVPYVLNEAACADGIGWFYDDPIAPTEIRGCPALCAAFDSGSSVTIYLGCPTVSERCPMLPLTN